MKQLQWLIGTGFLGAVLIFGFSSMTIYADGSFFDRDDDDNDAPRVTTVTTATTVAAKSTVNSLYKEECSSCHMAYPSSMLPEKSWNKIMYNLENHFDENAELDPETNRLIRDYLGKNSLGKVSGRWSRKMARNFPKNRTPIRITKLPYFIHKHDEVPSRMVKGNPKVGSFSQCDKCHRGAEKGNFNEHQVRIPGYARWE